MIENFLNFQWGSFYGGSFGNFLFQLESLGFFSYILPFLLIFALVFGILIKMKIFKDNKGINTVIALAIALLSLQFNFVPIFFSEIFPRLGVGLAVILVLLIVVGFFLPAGNNKYVNWVLLIIAIIIFLIIIFKTFSGLGYLWQTSYFWYAYFPQILAAIFIIVLIGIIVSSVGPKKRMKVPEYPVPYYKSGNDSE